MVEAKKGERITAEVEGIRLGITLFDPYVAILDAKRFELASSDDAALIWQDGVRLGRRPRGRHVHHPGPRERLRGQRRLPLPAPRRQLPPADGDASRPAASSARSSTVRWIGDVAGRDDDRGRRCRPTAEPRLRPRRRRTTRGSPPTRTPSGSSPFGNVIEAEPNDDHAHATPFTAPDGPQRRDRASRATSTTSSSRPRRGRPSTSASSPGSSARRSTRSCTSAKKGGGRVAGNDDSGGPRQLLPLRRARRTASTSSGSHDHLSKGGPDYAYRIEVSPVEPKLTLSVAERADPAGDRARWPWPCPKGNRQAILDQRQPGRLRRRPRDLALEGLPAGRGDRGRHDGRQPGRPSRSCSRPSPTPRSPAPWPASTGKPADPKVDVPSRVQPDRRAGPRPEQRPVLDPDRRHAGRGRDRGGPVLDRDRRAEGAAGPRRLDGPEGRGEAQAGLQGADRGLPALEPAGRRLGRAASRSPRGRTRPSSRSTPTAAPS